MRFQHNFGRFHETLRVDGHDYTFSAFSELNKAEREALREEAVDRCVHANQKVSAEGEAKQIAIRERYQPLLDAIPTRFKRGTDPQVRRQARLERRELEQARHRELCAVWDHIESVDGVTYPAAVFDVFTVWERRVETDWERLERLLKHHDWYYSFSDDFRYWSAGERSAKEIRALVAKLGPKAQEMYEAARPKQ